MIGRSFAGVRTGDRDGRQWHCGAKSLADFGGVYRFIVAGSASWCDFARAIANHNPRRAHQVVPEIEPITTREYPTPAQRPLNSLLDCTALRDGCGVVPPHWQASLETMLEEMRNPAF